MPPAPRFYRAAAKKGGVAAIFYALILAYVRGNLFFAAERKNWVLIFASMYSIMDLRGHARAEAVP